MSKEQEHHVFTSSGSPAVTRGHTAICENSLQRTEEHFNIGHVGFLETALKLSSKCLTIMKFLDENHLKSVLFICIGQSMLLISLCTYAISVLQYANDALIMIM